MPTRPASPTPAWRSRRTRRSPPTYTSRANLVGVVTNGTAVLGLGDIGPLAGKPVMEGKGCLFKKFAGIDVFDIELAERDPDKLVDIVAALEPTLGGVNLEDIKAPECFYIERKLRERMNIPVFHDDQHGTAIISAAALLNGLELVGKKIGEVKLAVSGAGAAAIACLDVMVGLGVKRENIFVVDSKGVLRADRDDFKSGKADESKHRYCQRTDARTLADVVQRRRRLPRLLDRRRADRADGHDHGRQAHHPGAGQPRAGDPARARARRRGPTASSPPGAATTRTRSTTSCASRTSSAARSTAARPRSPSR